MTVASALAALLPGAVWANPEPWELNMPKGVTPVSHQVYDIHMMALWVCVGLGVLVFGAMMIAMIRFRQSKGAVAAKWNHSAKVEAIWTTVPILLLIAMAVPASIVVVNMDNATQSEMTVKVTGYQWLWRYDYIDYHGKPVDKVGFVSKLANDSNRARQLDSGIDPWTIKSNGQYTYLLEVDQPLVLPTNTKIRFMITAGDVIHSWWVPEFGLKKDAIPGVINTVWAKITEPGIYRGQCAELCGQDHAYMPVVVKAVPPAEFQQWLAAREGDAQVEQASHIAQTDSTATPTPRG